MPTTNSLPANSKIGFNKFILEVKQIANKEREQETQNLIADFQEFIRKSKLLLAEESKDLSSPKKTLILVSRPSPPGKEILALQTGGKQL